MGIRRADERTRTAALAWLLHQGDDIVPIPGTKRCKCLEENTAAVDVTLTEEDLRRNNEAFMRTVNR